MAKKTEKTNNKAAASFEKALQLTPMIRTWADKHRLIFLKRFCECSTITPRSIQDHSFIEHAVEGFVAPFADRVLTYFDPATITYICTQTNGQRMPETYSEAVSKAKGSNWNGSQYQLSGSNVVTLMLQFPDTFRPTCEIIAWVCDYLLKHHIDETAVEKDLITRKFPQVVKFFNMSDDDVEILKFCLVFRLTGFILPRDIQDYNDRMRQLHEVTGVKLESIEARTKAASKSKKFMPYILETISLQDNIWRFLTDELSEEIESYFYQTLKTDDALPRDFFGEIDAENTDIILSIINGNKKVKRPRHVLLYGLPGTGKTSYAKLLCKLSKRTAYVISDGQGQQQPGPQMEVNPVVSRLMAIGICDSKIEPSSSVIIVDEADSLINCEEGMFGMFNFVSNRYNTKTKTLLNQIMDSTETPVIWVTNNRNSYIDPSCRRRFDYSLYFENFNETQRATIWKNVVSSHGLGKMITADMIKNLAAQYNITPGGISTVCKGLIDVNPPKKEVSAVLDKLLDKHAKLMDIPQLSKQMEKFSPCEEYSLDGLNVTSTLPVDEIAEMCKVYLEKKSKGNVRRAMSILFSGPSGTGKTEYVKYLGSILKKRVKVVHASTILDMYVGNTEKHIAEAFREAEKEDEILFMDEIDGLLMGREKAQRTWEVSQVNEILTQMENFRGIFVGASNFSDNLDSASIRRFTFKFKFDYLTEEGILAFFKRYFWELKKSDKYYDQIRNLRNVAPGDFALVKMLSEYTKDKIDSKWVYESLDRELKAKKSNAGLSSVKPKNMGY